jgi:predicted DsbA family dithiol-disulfide isomerase
VWMERQFGARLTWLPFDLHPEYPPEGIPRADLVARYGDGYDARTREMFAAEGLVYAPPPGVVSNTRMALELGEQARAEGVHRAYHDRVMDAYWAEGVDLSERPALEQLARDAGVSAAGIEQALDDGVWARAVDDSTRRAQAAGATGVPSFVIDWRLLVIGAQPRELLAEAIAQARALVAEDRAAQE